MNREGLKKLTEKYVQMDREYKEYVGKFFSAYFPSNEKPKDPQKVLTKEELNKIQKMREGLNKLREEWLREIRSAK